MRKYRVLLQGHNFLCLVNDRQQRLGFYSHIFVEAPDEATAEQQAVEVLQQDAELQGEILNEQDDPPVMSVEEIEELESFDGYPLPRTGLALFPEDE
jgi:hypothetical protein